MVPMLSEWQRRRSEFNHDWLKNQFLNRLNAFRERLRGAKPDIGKLRQFLREDLPEWDSHECEARWLIECVEHEMSPRRFFDYPPLTRCSEETKEWLPDVIHELWLNRYPVLALQKHAGDSLSKASKRYGLLKKRVQELASMDSERLVSLAHDFSELSRLCGELHDALSEFDIKMKRI